MPELRQTVEELRRGMDALSKEVEQLRIGGAQSNAGQSALSHMRWGAYGELNFNGFSGRNQKGGPSAADQLLLAGVGQFSLAGVGQISLAPKFKLFPADHGRRGP